MKLTQDAIAAKIMQAVDLPANKSRQCVAVMLAAITRALASGDTVELRNFGVFKAKWVKPRLHRNPSNSTAELFMVPGRYCVRFKAGKQLRKLSLRPPPDVSSKIAEMS